MSRDLFGSEADTSWDEQARHETPTQRLDRNWSNLLQELRVVQTGVQLLTGFLLTLPFQQRFTTLDTSQRVIYLAIVALCVLSTVLLIAPVAVHRILFRHRAVGTVVAIAHVLAIAGLVTLSLALIGVIELIFAVVASTAAGLIAACATLLVIGVLAVVTRVIIARRR